MTRACASVSDSIKVMAMTAYDRAQQRRKEYRKDRFQKDFQLVHSHQETALIAPSAIPCGHRTCPQQEFMAESITKKPGSFQFSVFSRNPFSNSFFSQQASAATKLKNGAFEKARSSDSHLFPFPFSPDSPFPCALCIAGQPSRI
ncbi:hypothetical protein AVEN_72464-1 [Araneus ventricosus]|uniref:Uncharacterized protein n=1 Tax=Araneus ventricosus TaxID=182803 RepID=A0A4Y2SGR6_ARAVE|nr:hypothetical protein AVEN_72464-1 [Araneus ventricosus]